MNLKAFHDAIARPNFKKGLKIGRDNESQGWKDCLELIGAGVTYCVYVRNGLATIDIDHGQGVNDALRAITALESKGFKTVLLESRKGSQRAHLYIPFDSENEYREIIQTVREHVDKFDNRSRSMIRPPFSPHRFGQGYEMILIHPRSEAEALEILKQGKGKTPKNEFKTAEKTASREPKTFQPINEEITLDFSGVPKGERSDALYSLAGKCKALGWSEEEFANEVLKRKYEIGEKAYEKRDPKTWLIKHIWSKARRPLTATENQELRDLENIRVAAIKYIPEKRQAGAKQLLLAIIETALKQWRSTEFSLSVREAGALTGSTGNTGQKRIDWLIEAGFLVRTEPGSVVLASKYRLQIPNELKRDTPERHPEENQGGVCECINKVHLCRDAFIGWGLAYVVLVQLVQMGSASSKEIAQVLGRNHSSIKRNLKNLHSFGLVCLEDGIYRATITEGRLLEVAKARGKAGKIERAEKALRDHAEARRAYLEKFGTLSRRTLNQLRNICDRRTEKPRESLPDYAYMAA